MQTPSLTFKGYSGPPGCPSAQTAGRRAHRHYHGLAGCSDRPLHRGRCSRPQLNLEPYIVKSMRYLIAALEDFGRMFKGRKLAPLA
jgi:hypothetical protein